MNVVLKKYISFFFRMFRAKHVISFLPWISKILIAKTIDLSIKRGVLCYNYDWKRYDNHSHYIYIYIQWIMSAERTCRPTIHLISSQWLRLDRDLSCRNWGYMFCKFMISAYTNVSNMSGTHWWLAWEYCTRSQQEGLLGSIITLLINCQEVKK